MKDERKRQNALRVRTEIAEDRMIKKYFHTGQDKSGTYETGKKRIAIVGLRKAQAGIVTRKCEGIAQVDCVNADRSDARLPRCDHVIVMRRFTGHRWTQSAYRS